jgi:cytochrome P450
MPFATYLYYLPITPFKQYKSIRLKYRNELKNIYKHIRDMKAEGKLKPDSLAMSILNFADMEGVTESCVLAELGTFFIAGMDTTAHTLSFFVYCLARNTDIQKRCQTEVDKLLATSTVESASGTLPAFVEAVLKESMRKFPVAAPGSFREVKNADGYRLNERIHLPQGWWVVVNLLALHNHEGNWGDDVHEFKPERWLDGSPDPKLVDDANIDPLDVHGTHSSQNHNLTTAAAYAGTGFENDELCFAPFSFGTRNCLGMNLALMELRVTILMLISKFEFELADKSMLAEENLLMTSFTMQPQKGLPVRIRKRV